MLWWWQCNSESWVSWCDECGTSTSDCWLLTHLNCESVCTLLSSTPTIAILDNISPICVSTYVCDNSYSSRCERGGWVTRLIQHFISAHRRQQMNQSAPAFHRLVTVHGFHHVLTCTDTRQLTVRSLQCVTVHGFHHVLTRTDTRQLTDRSLQCVQNYYEIVLTHIHTHHRLTTPGLHPVSIHQMAPPKQTSECSSLFTYWPQKDERLSGPS